MIRVASALACLLLVVLSAAAPATAVVAGAADGAPAVQQSEGSLSLTVTDGDDPVSSADVTLYRDGEQVLAGETDGDGTLDTGPIAAGEYRIEIREPGYHEATLSVAVDGETSHSVTLDPGSVELTVDVADVRTGDPLSDVAVDIGAAGEVRTGADGTQTVRVPVNSDVGLVVTKDGYERESLSVVVDESPRSVTLDLARETDVSLSLSSDSVTAGGSVEATVTDAYGDPVAGASLLLDGEVVAETGADGTATVPVEQSGERTVRARTGGALSAPQTVVAEGGSGGVSTASATESGNDTETATPGESTSTETAAATATPGTASEESPFSDLPLPDVEPPEFGDREGPLGLVPPIEGSARIVLVLAGIGAVGLVLSILREDDL